MQPKFSDIPQLTLARYHVNISWLYLEEWMEETYIDMNPDYQRSYVWNEKQKERYIEWILKGGQSGKDIYFNHPGWFRDWDGNMEIVDGKQRISAVIGFLHDTVKAYGYYRSEYKDKLHYNNDFNVHVLDLTSREKLLQWYVDMNSGGTIHTDKDINKVKDLLNAQHSK